MRRDEPSREPSSEPGLTIRLFGGMAIQDSGGMDYLPRSRKARAIVAMLTMTSPKTALRSQLTALLWSQRRHIGITVEGGAIGGEFAVEFGDDRAPDRRET